jgi:hypothetical protein
MAWSFTAPTAAVVAATTEGLSTIPTGAVVSSILLGTGNTTAINIRNIGGNRLRAAGTLNISPEYEQIIASGMVVIEVPTGGRLNINGQYGNYYSTNKWLHMTGIYNYSTGASLTVFNGGRLDWTGGAAFLPGGIAWEASSIINIKNAILDSLDFDLSGNSTADEQQIRQFSNNCTIDGFTLYRGFFTLGAIPLLLKGYKPRFCGQALAFSGQTPDADIPIFGFDTDGSNVKDVAFHAGCRPVLTAPIKGSMLKIGHNAVSIDTTQAFGLLRVNQPVRVAAKIGSTGINGVAYIRDTNNGQRRNYSSESFASNPFDGVSDRVYVQPITAGTSAQFDVLSAVAAINQGTATIADQGLISTGVFRIDFRGKENNDSDKFDIYVWAYAAQPKVGEFVLKGENGDANLVVVAVSEHLADSNVTLNPTSALTKLGNSFTVSTTGVGTITVTANSTYDDVYDAPKAWKCQPVQAQLEFPSIGVQPVRGVGTELQTDMNIVVNAGVTLSEGVKFKTLTTTATITGNVAGAFFDANNAGSINAMLTSLTDNVEMRKASDNSLIATRTGAGSFAVSPSNVGVAVYFERKTGSNLVMSTITTPVTLTSGVNTPVPLYAGAEVQVAQAPRIDLLPTAAQIRTELATELARVDATISSRLASASYTAPDNTSVAAIKVKTDNLPASPAAVGSEMNLTSAYERAKTAADQASVNNLGLPLQSNDYTAPDNISIAAIKAKTDTLVNTDVSGLPSLSEIEASSVLNPSTIVNSAKTAILNAISSSETSTLSAISTNTQTLSTKLGVINANVKDASLLIPATRET